MVQRVAYRRRLSYNTKSNKVKMYGQRARDGAAGEREIL
jgi:hypothetical protein